MAPLTFGCTAASSSRQEGAVQISVDATVAGGPLERVWAFHGYDEVNYTTTPEGEALLRAVVAAHSAPVHVRNHFLLNTGDGTPAPKWGSTDVYREDAAGSPIYDWTLTDGILDAITDAGALPFVELGFMPQALSSHPLPYQNASSLALDSGCFYPPTDYGKWAALVETWAAHVVARYRDVEKTWRWELWNEPDSGYWHGSFEEYAKLYDHTEAAVHRVLPGAALGGPAVLAADGPFLTQFLEHCASGDNAVTGGRGTRLDAVTFHAKGGVGLDGDHVQMNLGNQLRLHRAGFRAVASFPSSRETPIYITEADPDGCAACSSDLVAGSAYRSSTVYGAYEAAMMKRTLELEADEGVNLQGVLTWAFTFPDAPYFDGSRALATHGINLPIMGVFELLGRLAGTRLSLTSTAALPLDDVVERGVRGEPDIDGMAALDATTIRVLVWNYHDDVEPTPAAPVHLTVKVPASFGRHLRVSHLRVDETHGDAHSVWLSQGSPALPSAEQIAALRAAMHPASLGLDQIIDVSGDASVSIDFDLPRFGVSLVTLTPGD